METSDESFAWTDASSDSSKNMSLKMEQNDSEHGSDYDEAYKKELLIQLAETIQYEHKGRGKKQKKLAVSEELENDDTDFEINRTIKSEPSSDFDVKSKIRTSHIDAGVTNNYDESLYESKNYLNLRVKQEQATFVQPTPTKSKKKKRHREQNKTIEEQKLHISIPLKKETYIREHDLDSTFINCEYSNISETDSGRKKKKKKKKKLSIDEASQLLLLENTEDTNSDNRKKKKKKKTRIDNDTSELEDSEGTYKTKKKKHKTHAREESLERQTGDDGNEFEDEVDDSKIVSSTLINNSICSNVKEHEQYDNYLQNASTLLNSSKSTGQISLIEGPLKKSNRISDRIRFEEDSIDLEPNDYISNNNLSLQLKQFINSNSNLTPVHTHCDSVITADDELWILKGPHEISIEDLKNTNLTLDSRRKVKLNGKSYESIIDNSVCASAILLYNKNNMFIKNMPLMGVMNLRKRIPKVHIPYESLMVNNDNSFISLPDTKCRHPLFGIHYKKATKLPTIIAERFIATQTINPATPLHVDNKKKKKHKSKTKFEVESEIEVKPSIELIHSNNRKRKRKHGDDNGASEKVKRVKYDAGSADAWESERAIEENLFNF